MTVQTEIALGIVAQVLLLALAYRVGVIRGRRSWPSLLQQVVTRGHR